MFVILHFFLLFSSGTFIHPFNDYSIMAGQGTIGLEILEQLPDVDMIFVPIGGGGLLAGLAYAVKNLRPQCRIIGVQAAGAPSMAESLKAVSYTHLDVYKRQE